MTGEELFPDMYYVYHTMYYVSLLCIRGDRSVVYDPSMHVTSRGKKIMSAVLEQSRQLCLQRISYLPKSFTIQAQRIIGRLAASFSEGNCHLLVSEQFLCNRYIFPHPEISNIVERFRSP